jgi:predicted anti-sigma-YlaC factor YlaD
VMNDSEATIARRRAARVTVNAALPIVAARDLALAPGTFPGCAGCFGIFFGIAAVGALIAYITLTDHNSGDSALLVVGAIAALLSLLGLSQPDPCQTVSQDNALKVL